MTSKLSLFGAVLASHLLLLVFVMVSSAPVENQAMGSNMPLTMQYMGSIDGKSYYKDQETRMNWTDAGDYCQRYNLTLATIQTRAQTEFLKTALDISVDYSVYWIAGRESRLPSMMVWNGTGVQLNESLADYWDFSNVNFYCASVDLGSVNDFRLFIRASSCTTNRPVICET